MTCPRMTPSASIVWTPAKTTAVSTSPEAGRDTCPAPHLVFGAFVVVRAIVSGLSVARRLAHSDQQSSTSPLSPGAQIPLPWLQIGVRHVIFQAWTRPRPRLLLPY